MHDPDFVQGLLAEVKTSKGLYHTADRIKGLLTVLSEVSVFSSAHLLTMGFDVCR